MHEVPQMGSGKPQGMGAGERYSWETEFAMAALRRSLGPDFSLQTIGKTQEISDVLGFLWSLRLRDIDDKATRRNCQPTAPVQKTIEPPLIAGASCVLSQEALEIDG